MDFIHTYITVSLKIKFSRTSLWISVNSSFILTVLFPFPVFNHYLHLLIYLLEHLTPCLFYNVKEFWVGHYGRLERSYLKTLVVFK